VRELEIKNGIERKKLMQTIYGYLGTLQVQSMIIQEPDPDSTGADVTRSIIKLKGQRVNSIQLVKAKSFSCSSGEALRFQYRIQLAKELPRDLLSGLKTRVAPIKEGKILGLFGGKIVGVRWIGQRLADMLNRDPEISKTLLRCMQTWDVMEIEIEASSKEVLISGPWFTNPNTIISLYAPGKEYEEQNCVFGYKTIDRIARLIQESLLGEYITVK
jgi:hypothetical protein